MMSIADKIKELLPSGMSFSQMGAELGVTRNTIAGQVSRMRARGELDDLYRPIAPRAVPESPLDQSLHRNIKAAATRLILQEEPDQDVGGVHLLDLNAGDCRWSVGITSKGHFFCGEPRRDPRTSYCAEHHKRVWVRIAKRPKEECAQH